MIRALLALTVLVVLILVFYIPSTRDAHFFRNRMQAEDGQTATLWGPEIAARIRSRSPDALAPSSVLLPIPQVADGPRLGNANKAVAREMDAVNLRLFGNRYFESIRQLQRLAGYRLSHVLYWLPWLAALLVASLADGGHVRQIRSRGLDANSPETFGLLATLVTLVICATIVALLLPTSNPPGLWPCLEALVAVLTGRLLASFHARAG
jgi:Domain of unknown function (DUF4400)